jgi:hypothetical protein
MVSVGVVIEVTGGIYRVPSSSAALAHDPRALSRGLVVRVVFARGGEFRQVGGQYLDQNRRHRDGPDTGPPTSYCCQPGKALGNRVSKSRMLAHVGVMAMRYITTSAGNESTMALPCSSPM